MINVNKKIEALQATDRILLDTNACLFIFGPTPYKYKDPDRSKKYDNSQNKWGKGNVYICRPVLSEFVNKCRDYHWKRWKRDENPREDGKKDFRNSFYYKNNKIADLIAQYVMEMLIEIECCDSEFDKTKTFGFLSEFSKCKMDFNDIIIEEICKENNLALVTDDGDFKNCSIPIFTANE
ncbi:PIN domain protein [uncultured archaeon]|nr:PIN domain protein [uncultured archaeon]